MKIEHEIPGLFIVREELLEAFLKDECGISQHRVDQLTIRLVWAIPPSETDPGESVIGRYSPGEEIILVSYQSPESNKTLLHEIRHFMLCGYEVGEGRYPWRRRPSEYDATGFAQVYHPRYPNLLRPMVDTARLKQVVLTGVVLLSLLAGAVIKGSAGKR